MSNLRNGIVALSVFGVKGHTVGQHTKEVSVCVCVCVCWGGGLNFIQKNCEILGCMTFFSFCFILNGFDLRGKI